MQNITIVIVTYKSEEVINKCLSSINKKIPVIVIENSNNKKFKKEIEKKFPNVLCFLMKKNLGFGRANNIGINLAKTEYVFVLNPDTILFKNTIQILLKSAFKIKDFALLAPRIANSNILNYGFFNKQIKKKQNSIFEVDYIKGFAMFFNKKKFKRGDFFDENIFLYLEEIDLCKRLNLAGEKIYIVSKSKINHLGGKSHGKYFNLEIELSRNWHWMWSMFYYNKKHYNLFKAYILTLPIFFKSFLKLFFYFPINKKKFLIHKFRFEGLLNAYKNKKSFYRPCDN